MAGNRPHVWEVGQARTVRLEQLSVCPAIVFEAVNKYKGLFVIQSKVGHRENLHLTELYLSPLVCEFALQVCCYGDVFWGYMVWQPWLSH